MCMIMHVCCVFNKFSGGFCVCLDDKVAPHRVRLLTGWVGNSQQTDFLIYNKRPRSTRLFKWSISFWGLRQGPFTCGRWRSAALRWILNFPQRAVDTCRCRHGNASLSVCVCVWDCVWSGTLTWVCVCWRSTRRALIQHTSVNLFTRTWPSYISPTSSVLRRAPPRLASTSTVTVPTRSRCLTTSRWSSAASWVVRAVRLRHCCSTTTTPSTSAPSVRWWCVITTLDSAGRGYIIINAVLRRRCSVLSALCRRPRRHQYSAAPTCRPSPVTA